MSDLFEGTLSTVTQSKASDVFDNTNGLRQPKVNLAVIDGVMATAVFDGDSRF
jgi:hypothetical protein